MTDIENLWYPVNYYHYQYRETPSNRAERPKRFELKNRAVHEIGKRVEQQRLRALLEGYMEFSVMDGKLERGVLPGFGTAHVNETAVTIHHTYAIPYIPSSSVKGVVRRWYIQQFLEGKEENLLAEAGKVSDDLRQKVKMGQLMFGSQAQSGLAQFYDVYFHNQCRLTPNLMITIFGDYYGKGTLANDTMRTLC